MTHCACSPGFARLVQRALQEKKVDLYESAEAMLKDKDMHEAIKCFETDMQKAIEAQEAMLKKLLDEHAHELGELQNEHEQCKQALLAQRGQTITVHDISDDNEDPEWINVRETRLLQEAEAERFKLSEEMDTMARAHAEATRQLLGQHEQKRMRLEENTRIDLGDWARMEQQMRQDVNEFETKVVAERKRRSVDRERERQARMLEFENNLDAVFSEDAILPAALGGEAAQTKKQSERISEFQQQLAIVIAEEPVVDSLAPLREQSVSSAIARGNEGVGGGVREREKQERMLHFEKNLDAVFSEDAASGNEAAQSKKQSERMSKFQQQLAAVFAEEPVVDPLAPSRERTVSSAIARGNEGVGGGDRERERQERILDFEKNLDAVFSEDAILPAALGGEAAQTKKQNEKTIEFQQQLATVSAGEPAVDPLAPSRERSISSAIARGDGGIGGGGSHLPRPPPVPLADAGGVWQRQRYKRPSVSGMMALQHSQQVSLQNLPPHLQTQPQEPLVSKTFISVLPYSIDEFTADLHTKYKLAVADTCCVSIDKVFYLLIFT